MQKPPLLIFGILCSFNTFPLNNFYYVAEIILELKFYSLFFMPDFILFAFPMALKKKSLATKFNDGVVSHPLNRLGISVVSHLFLFQKQCGISW